MTVYVPTKRYSRSRKFHGINQNTYTLTMFSLVTFTKSKSSKNTSKKMRKQDIDCGWRCCMREA